MNFNNISSWSIRNPIPIILMFVVLTIAGIGSYFNLRTNNFPDVDLPVVAVTIVQAGASPTEMETQVTRMIEDSVAGLGQVRHITSVVNEGVSTTSIEFQLGVDLEKVTNDVRNAVSRIRQQLPADVQEPIVQRIEFTAIPFANFVVRAPGMSPEELSWFVDDTVSKRLLSIRGISQVSRDGGVSREIRIKLDPARLEAFGVTASAVSNQLRAQNINLPGGRGQVGGSEQAIRTVGSAQSVEELRETLIPVAGRTVRLGDLGEVTDEWSEQRGRARFNGQEVVGFGISRAIGSSEVDVYHRAVAELEQLDAERADITVEEVANTTEDVINNFHASVETLLLGALLAVAVVFIFLRDWRATIICACAIPLSLIPTFWIMDLTGQSLNVVSLLALSLTIGVLVDDAIVEIENIVRHIRDGKAPYPAAIEAADEIGLAVVATTATLIAVFAPTGFMPGVVGQFFKSFAIAACVSVFFSLVVARTLTPLMGAYLLRRDQGKEHGDPFWMAPYLRAVRWSQANSAPRALAADRQAKRGGWMRRKLLWRVFDHRIWVLGIGTVFFIFSIFLASQLPGEFIPVEDISRSTVTVQMAPGTTLEETDAAVERITDELMAQPEVRSVYSSIGSATVSFGPGGGNSAGEVRRANLTVNLTKRADRSLTQQEFERKMGPVLAQVPGARIQFGVAGGGSGLLTIALVGDDPEVLEPAAARLERDMRQIDGLSNVISSSSLVRPEILITPKADVAALQGVSSADISQVARVATLGDADQLLPKFNLGDRQVPIRVMLRQDAREDLSVLQNLKVPTSSGAVVPLSSVADITFGAGPNQIDRLDRRRVANITAELTGVALSEATVAVNELDSMTNLPDGVEQQLTGDAESNMELVTGFLFAIVTGILLMYVVLVLLFGSFFHPITILAALPVSFGGAFLALLITDKSLSMPALIGIIMLTGIAAKNSILLVDYAIMAMKGGMNRNEALIDAAHKRARPIIMTTFAMGLGMLPIAMAFGEGTAFRSPMAIAVIGGLITSTALSLLFVPVVFSIIDGIKTRLTRFGGRLFHAQRDAEPEERPAE
ncbi:MAG: efflux RND transporter permease subunit [Alphaproteobacteria bacterium]|nr:efflux RND transporter permease subunit [Alphaproteobacteria bacterium]MBU1527405.1 efflux RND transporter permease subunit [Alphaproteobacteria bacterium]MBU2117576.1 efflux RND transporter permease subunit [Alphaproteobacteria bacterium]MBU2350802.1 efflux RND transporter permease subunit [Alphaproteobacteria bacterium]MBU2381149.1 efflux RND transporter permease subunit [Alphaproteobacteria bacterium]